MMKTHTRRPSAAIVLLLLGCSEKNTPDASPADVKIEAAVDVASEPTSCDAPRIVCSGACVNTQWSHGNCGQCGRGCQAHEICHLGRCVRGRACPTTCASDTDCRTCTYDRDPTSFCCVTAAGATTGFCSLSGGCRHEW